MRNLVANSMATGHCLQTNTTNYKAQKHALPISAAPSVPYYLIILVEDNPIKNWSIVLSCHSLHFLFLQFSVKSPAWTEADALGGMCVCVHQIHPENFATYRHHRLPNQLLAATRIRATREQNRLTSPHTLCHCPISKVNIHSKRRQCSIWVNLRWHLKVLFRII